jgi:predicted TIM-barrel enzyme
MLHLTGATAAERLAIAGRETATLVAHGVDGVIVENYFGDKDDVRAVLGWLAEHRPQAAIGLNVLRDYRLAFALAEEFPVDFIQIDSVAGHLAPEEDADYAAELAERRAQTTTALFGGVRFKYQPVRSGRSEEEDLRIGMQRCDAIVVTGDATGQPTGLDKVRRFRAVTGAAFPLLIGAGLTAASAAKQLAAADGAIVGSFFKDTRVDTGLVLGAHVEELMQVVRAVRADAGRS